MYLCGGKRHAQEWCTTNGAWMPMGRSYYSTMPKRKSVRQLRKTVEVCFVVDNHGRMNGDDPCLTVKICCVTCTPLRAHSKYSALFCLKRNGKLPFTPLYSERQIIAVQSTEQGTLVRDAYDDNTNVRSIILYVPLSGTRRNI